MTDVDRNRLVRTTARLLASGSTGIAPYLTAGDGGFARTRSLLEAVERAGASCVELGVPFSDPIADGPVLQAAASRALDGGATLDGVVRCVRDYRARGGALPLICFSYLNPLLSGGVEARLDELADAGFDGLLVPDLPVEESGALSEAARGRGLTLSLFCAPTTSPERLAEAAERTTGFLYVVGRVGVTGRSTAVGDETSTWLGAVRAAAPGVPLGLGFGLRTPEQVASLRGRAELAIVGSALVDAIHHAGAAASPSGADAAAAAEAERFVTALAAAASAVGGSETP